MHVTTRPGEERGNICPLGSIPQRSEVVPMGINSYMRH